VPAITNVAYARREDALIVKRVNGKREASVGFMGEDNRWRYFENNRKVVAEKMGLIASLSRERCLDADYLEKQFIPMLGLNDEILSEQPQELSPFFGQGLHLWQYPNQLGPYLVWLATNALKTRVYLEIGCRWGGMFILISEWLRRFSSRLDKVIAVDPIGRTPLIDEYFRQLSTTNVQGIFLKDLSTSPAVKEKVHSIKPDFVFVDGDHTLQGALLDHMLAREHAQIVVHHDICSQACPGTTLLWSVLKDLETGQFGATEFVRQYPSVEGNFLGIGVLKRLQ
jgi:hypothetical protein